MSALDDYSDEELGRLLREYGNSMSARERERVSTLDAFCSWLEVVGLGLIAVAIKTSLWAWDRVRSIWRSIFG